MGPTPTGRSGSRRWSNAFQVSTLAAISAGTVTASTVGLALVAGLLSTSPTLLLILSPANLVLLLVAHRVPFVAFFGVGICLLVLAKVAPYLLGYLHGRRGVELVVRRDRHRRMIERQTEQLKPTALVGHFLSASLVVAAICGLVRIRPAVFVALDVVGSTARLVLFWWLAGLFATQLDAISELIEDWQPVLLAVGLCAALLLSWIQARRKRRAP